MGFISFILQQSSSRSQPDAPQPAHVTEAPAEEVSKAKWQKPSVSPIQVAKPAPKIKTTSGKKGK